MTYDNQISLSHNEDRERNHDIDIIKGILIILVVMGHKIQNGSGEIVINSGCYWDDPLFKLIYMFHMPCFALVSGFLFYRSVQRKRTMEIIVGRIKSLIIPILSVTVCIVLVNHFVRGANYSLKDILVAPFNVLWYLQALFVASLLCLAVHVCFKDSIIPHLLILFACLITPDIFLSYLWKYLYFYFAVGYYCAIYIRDIRRIFESIWWLIASAIVFVICFLFWNKETYIYISKFSLLGQLTFQAFIVHVHRVLGSLSGSILFFCLYFKSRSFVSNPRIDKVMEKIGQASIGIYILDVHFFNQFILKRLTAGVGGINYLIVVFETILVLLFSYTVTFFLNRNKITRMVFLGGR